MDILGIGPLELLFILVIALVVLGPEDMVKAGRTAGKFLRTIITSPTYRTVQQTSRDLRHLPNRLMREAGLDEEAERLRKEAEQLRRDVSVEEIGKEMKKEVADLDRSLADWTTPPETPSRTIGDPSRTPDQDAAGPPNPPVEPPAAEPATDAEEAAAETEAASAEANNIQNTGKS